MTYWQIFMILAVVAFVLEMFTPAMFFLSIAVAALLTAGIAVFYFDIRWLIVIWSLLSVLILLFIRPMMKKFMHEMPHGESFQSEYIGKIVKVTEEITANSGAIAVYGERWDARLANPDAEAIPAGADVKIVRNESIVLYVEEAIGE